MNIDDVKTEEIKSIEIAEMIPTIFQKQHSLAIEYRPIELQNGSWVPNIDRPQHIDDPRLQRWIKDMFWRTTEEFQEALEDINVNLKAGWPKRWDNDAALRHFFEELADATHFLVEVSIVCEMTPEDVAKLVIDILPENDGILDADYDRAFGRCARVIHYLGLAANCLKNKPWKNTQMPTDNLKFRINLENSWVAWAQLWSSLGASLPFIYTLYMKKNAVNVFRQRTNY